MQPSIGGPVKSTVPVVYGASDSLTTKKHFQITPTLYLDRYDWEQRRLVEGFREEQYIDAQKMGRLAAQKAKFGIHSKTSQEIVSPRSKQEEEVANSLDNGDKKKALLNKTLAYLKQASETEQDEKRKTSQLALIERLTKVSGMLNDQITRKY